MRQVQENSIGRTTFLVNTRESIGLMPYFNLCRDWLFDWRMDSKCEI